MAGAYYLGDLQWNESNMIVVNGNVYDVDVALPEVLPMAFGDGTVSGWFEMPETVFKAKDFYCQSWLHADSVEYCTEGLSNVSVVLLNATRQRILGFTLTDSRGRFSFRHLPYGTYYLMADLPRYGRGFCAPVTLSVAHPDERDLRLFVNGQGRVAMACQGENLDETGVQLYPNPANDALVVNGLAVNEYYSILIMNSLGDIVKNEVSYPRADGSVVIGVGALPCGVYFLQLESASARVVTKFVK
ncbi:MAG: T9SS type A sorting domain-containing protein, partial [Bacteroidales bacterium]|nr:T9SS type A sorting domain-containing protein [Bacteroidales bacterium]